VDGHFPCRPKGRCIGWAPRFFAELPNRPTLHVGPHDLLVLLPDTICYGCANVELPPPRAFACLTVSAQRAAARCGSPGKLTMIRKVAALNIGITVLAAPVRAAAPAGEAAAP
jgi:hypothetical protein